MNKTFSFRLAPLLLVLCVVKCKKETATISVPKTTQFKPLLSDYNLYRGTMNKLEPATDVYPFEISASLFVNYAQKQRLLFIPKGQQLQKQGDGLPKFPDGSILVKTFYYPKDERKPELEKRIIESRVMIKSQEKWNVAAYVWNAAQTDATLTLKGYDTQIKWINGTGSQRNISYHVPTDKECIRCHQANTKVVPLAPTLKNMNRLITLNSSTINQLQHFQNSSILDAFDPGEINHIVDYNNADTALHLRARAYLEMACAHCHNPNGWTKAAEKGLDFRYTTPLKNTGLLKKKDKILKLMRNGEMPYLGTTTIDNEGLQLITNYINSL